MFKGNTVGRGGREQAIHPVLVWADGGKRRCGIDEARSGIEIQNLIASTLGDTFLCIAFQTCWVSDVSLSLTALTMSCVGFNLVGSRSQNLSRKRHHFYCALPFIMHVKICFMTIDSGLAPRPKTLTL